ncbi:MAG TPA: DnaB-like helicase N-terminal domain-containing protein, partial [Pyrinomonadaceae bacterium]|nr:DnaB-like helicase N-terminal domain-containing protein [Pyrinomonadaceae bacterium]
PAIAQKISRSRELQPTVAEKQLLELLLADAELRHGILARLSAADYEDLSTASLFRALIAMEEAGLDPDFETLSQKLEGDPAAAELLPALLMNEPLQEKDVERQLAAERCLDALRLLIVDRRIRELSSELAQAERSGEFERRDQLAVEQLQLTRLRAALLPKAEAMHS